MESTIWPEGVSAGLSLTYDGGQPSHREIAIPHLNSLNLSSTFFVDGSAWVEDVPFWTWNMKLGHEIGNGCLVLCGEDNGSLSRWTTEMVMTEIMQTNEMFRETAGFEPKSFAFPWGYPNCSGGGDYRFIPQAKFIYCRSGMEGHNNPTNIAPKYLKCIRSEGLNFIELRNLGQESLNRGEWVIYSFDGIGEGERAIDAKTHEDLVNWIAEQEEVWVAPISTIGDHLTCAN